MNELLVITTLLKDERTITFAPVVLSFLFSFIVTLRRPKRSKVFIPLLLESLVLTMAVVVVVSAAFPELYTALEKQGMYFQVLSMIIVVYAVRDIFSSLRGSDADSNPSNR